MNTATQWRKNARPATRRLVESTERNVKRYVVCNLQRNDLNIKLLTSIMYYFQFFIVSPQEQLADENKYCDALEKKCKDGNKKACDL